MKFVAMPHIKIIQAAVSVILFPGSNGIDVDLLLLESTGSTEKLSLVSDTPNIGVTNLKNAHSKAVKSDDALTYERIWRKKLPHAFIC